MIINLYETSLSDSFFSDFRLLVATIFESSADQKWLDSLKWRVQNMPNTTIFVAEKDNKFIGFKAGYATANNRYYSWLGGVIPEYRKQGLAEKMMMRQHNWLQKSPFKILETQVEQNNKYMIRLNLKGGFEISGFMQKDECPYLIMTKKVQVEHKNLKISRKDS